MTEQELRKEILEKTKEYYNLKFANNSYTEGDLIPFARRVFDENELVNLVDSSLDFWLTSGRYSAEFEQVFAKIMNLIHCILVKSGSSAKLVSF